MPPEARRIRARVLGGCLIAVLTLLPQQGWGAASPEDVARLESRLNEQKARAATLDQKDKTNRAALESLQGKLIDAAAELEKRQEEQSHLAARLIDLEKESADRADALAKDRATLNSLIVAMLRLAREPPALDLFFGDNPSDARHRSLLLRSLTTRIRAEAEQIADQIEKLDDVRRQAAAQKDRVTAARAALETQKDGLNAMIRTRQSLAEQTTSERKNLNERMAALAAEAETLRQLMDKVERETKTPKSPHSKASGQLRAPVAGRIVRHFGERDADGIASEGLTFAAAAAAPVLAPAEGRVVFAGPFRGYGTIVILDHGGGDHSFLAGFGRLDVNVGQSVARGEPLGAMPDTDDPKRRELTFEWRKNGETVKPPVDGK